jgi:hypothetical protein
MSETELQDKVGKALRRASSSAVPDFDKVWSAAEREVKRSRKRYAVVGGIAAAFAVVAIVVGNWNAQAPDIGDEYLITDALMNSTQWLAPSDALMPQHQFDIYQGISFPGESTDLQDGSLL